MILDVHRDPDLDRHDSFLVCEFHRADLLGYCSSFTMAGRTEFASRLEDKTELRTGAGLLKMLRFALCAALIKIFFRTLEHLIALRMTNNLLVQCDCRLLFCASISTLAPTLSTPLRLHSLPA